MKLVPLAAAAGLILTGSLLAVPMALAQPVDDCAGTEFTTPSGVTVCDPDTTTTTVTPVPDDDDAILEIPDVDLPGLVSPGTEGEATCSPGATVVILGESYTCPPAVPAPADTTVVVQPPAAGDTTIITDLPVTG
jgi:hypothetical protein